MQMERKNVNDLSSLVHFDFKLAQQNERIYFSQIVLVSSCIVVESQ